jgi:hypothetical protein
MSTVAVCTTWGVTADTGTSGNLEVLPGVPLVPDPAEVDDPDGGSVAVPEASGVPGAAAADTGAGTRALDPSALAGP